jgi:multicomponent Na+:H+ antiporter subunit C
VTLSLIFLIAMVVMYSVGFSLMLDRGLTRILLGFLLVGNATNLLIFLMSGDFGHAPIVGEADPEDMSDPLPQAFILTAIVITFAVSAFLLALIYRSYRVDAAEESDKVTLDTDDLQLAQTETLTADEVMDEELEETSDFDDPDSAAEEDLERDRADAEHAAAQQRKKAQERADKRVRHQKQTRSRGTQPDGDGETR